MTDTSADPRRPSKEVTLHVTGLHCTNCALSIERHLGRVGAKNPTVDFASGRTSFELQDPSRLPEIVEGIKGLGYSVTDKEVPHDHGRDVVLWAQSIVSAILTLPMILGMFFHSETLHDPFVQACLATPVFIIGILHFGASGLRSLKTGIANMDVLVAAGILAAYVASITTMIFNFGHEYIFFEAVGSIVTFMMIGHLLEELAVKRTTSAIEGLSRLQPQDVRRLTSKNDGTDLIETVALADIKVGDMLQVNSGDRCPTDGIIVRGAGSFDESMLTGEPLPVDRQEGETVTGGTVLIDGSAVVRATAVGDQTTLAHIIKLVRDAQQRKPSIQRIADSVSAVFVPAVLVIAVVTFLASTLLFDIPLAQAMVRALAIVVVACPCAMGLATPSAIMVALGRAARNGILIRGGDTLERLGQISHVAFDKTGTLTKGRPTIESLRTHNGANSGEVRSILVALQRASSHPIAQSILGHLQAEGAPAATLTAIIETKGVGIEGKGSDGSLYSCGGRNLASRLGVQMIDDIILTKNNTVLASLILQDDIRQEASAVVSQLKTLNCSTSLISGDTNEKCRDVAEVVGITSVHGECLPQQKVEILRQIQGTSPAAYVGDGINDAPTLAEAAVGVSLSSGSDIAIQSAQVLLTGGTIATLPAAIRLSRLTVSTIKQNLLWALLYNVVTVPLAASGFIPPVAGAFLMTASDLVIIGNSLRIKYRPIA